MKDSDFGQTGAMSNKGFGSSFKNKESPTWWFKKPIGEGKIINTLLGAGDDPLGRE